MGIVIFIAGLFFKAGEVSILIGLPLALAGFILFIYGKRKEEKQHPQEPLALQEKSSIVSNLKTECDHRCGEYIHNAAKINTALV